MILDLNDLNNLFNSKVQFKSQPKAPTPPDPVKTAEAQAAANKETAVSQAFLNNTNQTNPFGSVEFEGFLDDATGEQRFRSNTTLNPQAQDAFNAEQAVTKGTNELAAGQIERVGDAVSDPFSFEGMPGAPGASLKGRQSVEDSLYGRFSDRLNNRFDRDEDRLRNRLATQGITQGSEAFNTELEQFNFGKNDAFEGASAQAVAAGGAEQSRLFGLQGSERERAIQEASFLRNIPLNEVGALLGTGQVGMPQFGGPAQTGIGQTDVLGAYALNQQQQNANYQADQSRRNGLMGGLFGLASAGIGAYPWG